MSHIVNNAGIEVVLGKEATAEEILKQNADYVILACGAEYAFPRIPGVENANVAGAMDVLLNGDCKGDTIIIVGGGMIGCETAIKLEREGKHVTVAELLGDILLASRHAPNNDMALRAMLAKSNVEILTGTKLEQIHNDRVLVTGKDGGKQEIPCDKVIIAIGNRPNMEMAKELEGKVKKLFVIGDSKSPANILDAVSQGFHTARLMEELD